MNPIRLVVSGHKISGYCETDILGRLLLAHGAGSYAWSERDVVSSSTFEEDTKAVKSSAYEEWRQDEGYEEIKKLKSNASAFFWIDNKLQEGIQNFTMGFPPLPFGRGGVFSFCLRPSGYFQP